MGVKGVSISYDDNDAIGVVITAVRGLATSDSPLIINTPYRRHKFDDEETKEAGDKFMSKEMVRVFVCRAICSQEGRIDT